MSVSVDLSSSNFDILMESHQKYKKITKILEGDIPNKDWISRKLVSTVSFQFYKTNKIEWKGNMSELPLNGLKRNLFYWKFSALKAL